MRRRAVAFGIAEKLPKSCGAQKYGLESLALPKDSPVVKGDEVHEWEMPTIPSLRRPWYAQVRGPSGRAGPTVHEGAARENAAGRVMLRAYRRGASHRVQGLR
jgi:hypothetical protein